MENVSRRSVLLAGGAVAATSLLATKSQAKDDTGLAPLTVDRLKAVNYKSLKANFAVAVPPSLNGLLVTLPTRSPIWVIESGRKRGITSWEQFTKLFKPGASVYSGIDVANIPDGEIIARDAELITAPGRTPIWLFEHGLKRGIPSMKIFNEWQFNSNSVEELPWSVVNRIPNGPIIPGRT